MSEFIIRATGKYKSLKDGGYWLVESKNPDFKSKKKNSYEEAFEEFKGFIGGFVRELIPTGRPEIEFGDPIMTVKSERFSGIGHQFTLICDAEDAKISWTVLISHQVNRKLSEFEGQESVPA